MSATPVQLPVPTVPIVFAALRGFAAQYVFGQFTPGCGGGFHYSSTIIRDNHKQFFSEI